MGLIKRKSILLFLLLCIMLLPFVLLVSCGNVESRGGDTSLSGATAQSVIESHDDERSDGNPFGGGLENGGNYVARESAKNN